LISVIDALFVMFTRWWALKVLSPWTHVSYCCALFQIHFLFVFYDDDDKWLFTIKDSSMRLVDKAYLQAIW